MVFVSILSKPTIEEDVLPSFFIACTKSSAIALLCRPAIYDES
jgi:hypothetical protein